MLCGEAETTGTWHHRHHCEWIEREDGPQEWKGGRLDDASTVVWGSLVVEWAVQATGPGTDPGTVDPPDRCQGGSYELRHLWPPRPARTASIRRLRAALVDALGAGCHLCGMYAGAMVDHDHQTGRVRGFSAASATGCWRNARTSQAVPGPAICSRLRRPGWASPTRPASSGGPRKRPVSG